MPGTSIYPNRQIISPTLIQTIKAEYALNLKGIHGISHWARVMEIGLRLSKETRANTKVVQLFSIFHDSKRTGEKRDLGHGRRGALFAKKIQEILPPLTHMEFELLFRACDLHTNGLTEDDVTVQTCWDSDRLDLNRVGIKPDPKFLCTQSAKNPEIIQWANGRANSRLVPEFVKTEWGFPTT
jgi:uncharacterized protein